MAGRNVADGSGFFHEMKRRHVWRVAAAYAVTAWLLVQIATQVFPFFDIPDWVVRVVILLLALGFPVALALAWVYELTPEGIRRTEPADSVTARPTPATREIGRKFNAVILVLLIVAVAVLGARLLALQHHPAPQVLVSSSTGLKESARQPSRRRNRSPPDRSRYCPSRISATRREMNISSPACRT